MATKRVLLLGGHGKISLLMTPLLLRSGWHVTSVIRNSEQKGAIVAAGGKGYEKHLDVLVASLEEVKSEQDAKNIIEKARVEAVIWSAGAGGKGGAPRTYAVDRDAAKYFISASLSLSSVTTFLLISALQIRRHKAPWWSDADWEYAQKITTKVMPDYYKAKLAADEFLTAQATKDIGGMRYVILRPGTLTDDEATGKISFGKTKGTGAVCRADVAETAVELLNHAKGSGWFDLLSGDERVEDAVVRVTSDGVNSIEGESVEEMEKGP